MFFIPTSQARSGGRLGWTSTYTHTMVKTLIFLGLLINIINITSLVS
jgi:hypothetical protein